MKRSITAAGVVVALGFLAGVAIAGVPTNPENDVRITPTNDSTQGTSAP